MVFARLRQHGTNFLNKTRLAGIRLHGFATNAHKFAQQKLLPGLQLASKSLKYATDQARESDLFDAKQKENARKLNEFVQQGVSQFGRGVSESFNPAFG
ncbi:hypothetical protein DFS34DRAFT_644171 [Phlyctochytrium arcticum]|nr:hypothetical protein DFS34DRAFT_644171 [Phlyctochytrium arcticum]